MRFLVFTVVVLVAFAPVPGAAELVRVEMGVEDASAVPETYEELTARCTSAGLSISWEDPPYYSASFTATDPAMVGTVNVVAAADTITLSWIEFDDEAAAIRYATEMDTMYGGSGPGYFRYRRGGRRILQAYAQSGVGDNAEVALDLIAGR